MAYEVVCTENYLDVGLLVEKDYDSNPQRILARNSTCSGLHGYGGIQHLTWIHTGVFLSVEKWKTLTLDKQTEEILEELQIKHKKKKKFRIFK